MHRFFLVTLTLALTPIAGSADAQDWARLQTLPPEARLRIHLATATVDGRLREATDRCLVLDRRTLSRGDIEQIDWVRAQKARNAGRGLLIGLGIGAVYGTAVGQGRGRLNAAIWFGATAGLLGAVFGMGTSDPKIETVYQSRASGDNRRPTGHTGPSAVSRNRRRTNMAGLSANQRCMARPSAFNFVLRAFVVMRFLVTEPIRHTAAH